MIRRLFIAALCCIAFSASAATLTTQQVATLRADILGSEFSAQCVPSGDGPFNIATAYNLAKSPTFTVWKPSVTIRETGQAFNGAEWAGMTTANHTRLQTVAQYLMSYSPAIPGIRAMFDDIWSGAGGVNTRAALLVLWKRPALRVEALFAIGIGSDAVPATLAFEGAVSVADVIRACQ